MFLKPLTKKINQIITNLIMAGAIMMILAFLIIWSYFMLKIILGLFILIVAYSFFYGAYKLYSIKKDIEKMFKF